MTPEEAAAAIARPIGSIGSRFMFDPGTYADAAQHGYSGLDFYFAGRCGVLGDVAPEVVVAALGYFEAGNVTALWEQGVAVAGPRLAADRFAAACAQWGRDHFGEGVAYDELSSLAARVIAAAPAAGIPIFAGWREVDVPDDAVGAASLRLNVLRELRGNLHLVAIVAAGITPLEAVLAKGGPANAALFGFAEPYPDVDHLASTMDEIEARTNQLAAVPLAALDADERARFVDLVRATRGALV